MCALAEFDGGFEVHQQLGTQQWYDLLQRLKFSCYSKVYEFIRQEPVDLQKRLPAHVIEGILMGIVLGFFCQSLAYFQLHAKSC